MKSAVGRPPDVVRPATGSSPAGISTAGEPWAAHARQWNRLGPPLRPCPEDLERLHLAWRQSYGATGLPSRHLEILLLGVTPEIARFPWAADFAMTAVDESEAMIRSVWPGDDSRRRAIRSGWLNNPFAAGTFDLILSDCGLTPLAGPGQLKALGRELRRVLRPAGRVVMRHLARPSQAASLDGLVRSVASGAFRNFHELKLRLLMAMPESRTGVRLADAWECFQKHFPDRQILADRLGCAPEIVATIDAYRGREARYVFPTLQELAPEFAGFSLAAGPPGQYPFAECCPVFSLTPQP